MSDKWIELVRDSTFLVVMLGLITTVAAGCASPTEIVKLHDKRSATSKVYNNFLIVDVSNDPQRQALFENEIIDELRARGVFGVGAYPTLTFDDDVSRQAITDYGIDVGADAILLTRITSVAANVSMKEGRTEILSTCRGDGLVDYFLYDHEVIREPDALTAAYDAIVVTSLYDIASGEHIWSIQSSCFDKPELSEVLREEARAIVRQLQRDKLIQAP